MQVATQWLVCLGWKWYQNLTVDLCAACADGSELHAANRPAIQELHEPQSYWYNFVIGALSCMV